jgi:hypothetical protein
VGLLRVAAPLANVALTAESRRRIAAHWQQLERLKHLGR